MPHSYIRFYYHLVFATKYRRPLITPDLAPDLYKRIGDILRDAGGKLLIAGGIADHVHLLIHLPREVPVPDALRLIKSNSTLWVRRTFPQHREFGWQNGYGAFTVSDIGVGPVRRYIANQEEHHRTRSFHTEMDELWRSYLTAEHD